MQQFHEVEIAAASRMQNIGIPVIPAFPHVHCQFVPILAHSIDEQQDLRSSRKTCRQARKIMASPSYFCESGTRFVLAKWDSRTHLRVQPIS